MDNLNIIVGWKEWVSIPELGVHAIKAKIDTGASTSSIHAFNIEYFSKGNQKYVRFEVHPIQQNKKIVTKCVAKLVDKRHVKSSIGKKQIRPVIQVVMEIDGREFKILLNLTNRDSMGMRMLIGREALKKIMVNPNAKFLHGRIGPLKIKELYRS